MTTKSFSLTEAQSELAALKSELQEKRTAVTMLRDELSHHADSLKRLQAQRDKLALAAGLAAESVKGATAALRRNAGRPNEQFCKDALSVAETALRDATSLLEAFDATGHIKLANDLLQASQGKLKAAEKDVEKLALAATAMHNRFLQAFHSHGQSLFDAAIERLSRPGAHLRAQEQTLQQLQEHADAEASTVKALRAEQSKLVAQALLELADFPELAQRLAASYGTSESAAARNVLTAWLAFLEIFEQDGPSFRAIDGPRWWDLMKLLRLEWGSSFADEVPIQAAAIRAYLASLK